MYRYVCTHIFTCIYAYGHACTPTRPRIEERSRSHDDIVKMLKSQLCCAPSLCMPNWIISNKYAQPSTQSNKI